MPNRLMRKVETYPDTHLTDFPRFQSEAYSDLIESTVEVADGEEAQPISETPNIIPLDGTLKVIRPSDVQVLRLAKRRDVNQALDVPFDQLPGISWVS